MTELKNTERELHFFRMRLTILGGLVFVCFSLLLARFKAFGGSPESGLVFLPCELIEANGTKLKKNNYDSWLQRLAAWRDDPEQVSPDLTPAAWARLTPQGLAT